MASGLSERIKDPGLLTKVEKSMKMLRRALALYPDGKLAFSFNGGKDSTVLLHLLRAAAGIQDLGEQQQRAEAGPASAGGKAAFISFYFSKSDDFQELVEFVDCIDRQYGLQLLYLKDPAFKRGLQEFMDNTGATAMVLGTRKGDPNAGDQEFFSPSSEGWPAFMRVNPILDWTYHDVWVFLRTFNFEYCSLYDHGYTSLGSIHNTVQNSALQASDGSFSPAYMLSDGRLERAGRHKSLDLPVGPAPPIARPLQRAALLMVGDELLAGKVEDTNSHFLCQRLRALGYTVARVVLVPDKVADIAAELRLLSASYDLVITSGGVGPTCDDVTIAGVAQALGKPLVRNTQWEERLCALFGAAISPAHLKMADLPADVAELIDYKMEDGEWSRFPLLRCKNIYVLPGVPHLLRQKFNAIEDLLRSTDPLQLPSPFRSCMFRLALSDETVIAPCLNQLQTEFGSEVSIGSYPVTDQVDGAGVLITLDSKNPPVLTSAVQVLRKLLPVNSIKSEEEDAINLLMNNGPAVGGIKEGEGP